ncbi:hypothetical protein RBB50_006428 [Rhinocladiella similis]
MAVDINKLEVPLDYNRPSGPRVILSMLRPSAQANSTNGPNQGMLLFNPARTGTPSTQLFLSGEGEQLQEIFGTNWDFVTFDPRGVGYASPSANCTDYGDASLERRSERLTGPDLDQGFFHHSTAVAIDMLMLAEAFKQTRQGKTAPTSDLVNYLGFSCGTLG